MSLERQEAPATGDDADDELFDDAEDAGEDAGEDDAEEEVEDEEADPEGEGDEEERPRGPSKAEQKIEALAKDAGWKPRDKWKGEGWVPAEQFLKNAAKRASAAKREVRDLTERMSALEGAHKESLKRTVEALEAKAKAMKAEAIKKGGKDAAEIVEEIDEVLAEEKKKLEEAEPKPIKLTALDKKFFAENPWLTADDSFEDDESAEEADEAFELVQATIAKAAKSGKTAIEAYELAERALKKAFPHRYESDDEDDEDEKPTKGKKPARRAPELAGGRRQLGDGAGSAGALAAKMKREAPEAHRAALEYVKRGTYGSVEEYAEVYYAEQKKDRRA